MDGTLTAAAVARTIDHTLLKPEATSSDVEKLCREAARLGVFAVCVSPTLVPAAVANTPDEIAVATVCGFPSGAHRSAVKAGEAARIVRDGADEIDMVIDLGAVKSADWSRVSADISAVVGVAETSLVKVIIESAALTRDEVARCCEEAVGAGAAFVKTSTGFHPAGGASLEAVRLMRATVGPDIGVKASGGIRTGTVAVAMLEAGADRLGCSSSAAILQEVGEQRI